MTPDERRFLVSTVEEAQIRQLVVSFYDQVQEDPLLGPVFESKIQSAEWAQHLDRMTRFWSTILLASGRYRGNPMARHAALPHLSGEHFDRWLELFEATVEEIFEPPIGALVLKTAQGMRVGLQHAVERYGGSVSALH